MPIPCQGFTFTWGGTALTEVQELEADIARGLPRGRETAWTPTLGEVRLLRFAPGGVPASDYGKRRRLVIQGPAGKLPAAGSMTYFDADCIYQDVNISAAANDAMRFAYVFRVMDTVDAPTNP